MEFFCIRKCRLILIMKQKYIKAIRVLIIFLSLASAVFLYKAKFAGQKDVQLSDPTIAVSTIKTETNKKINDEANSPNVPLDQAVKRVVKKPFGLFVAPDASPVQPERFRGYHTGADFEILPGEEDEDVPMRAICSGKLRLKQFVSGYGGTVVQSCQISGQSVTVLYGHLSLASVNFKAGDEIKKRDIIGNLGNPAKSETDDERKHLHLAIRKGAQVDYRGYVDSQNELSDWIDPCWYFCK